MRTGIHPRIKSGDMLRLKRCVERRAGVLRPMPMDRRQFILALSSAAMLLGTARTSHAECGGEGSEGFVEDVYAQQAGALNAGTAFPQEEFQALFASDMRRLMAAPRRSLANEPDGDTLNAFFGWGVLPRSTVKIARVSRMSGNNMGPSKIGVDINHRGKQSRILVDVAIEDGLWRIADITYDSGKSLLAHYRNIATQ
jgi:hypothetical protein